MLQDQSVCAVEFNEIHGFLGDRAVLCATRNLQ